MRTVLGEYALVLLKFCYLHFRLISAHLFTNFILLNRHSGCSMCLVYLIDVAYLQEVFRIGGKQLKSFKVHDQVLQWPPISAD